MALGVRAVTADEAGAVKRVAQSRTEPVRRVERARIIWLSLQGERVPAIARAVGCSERTVRLWVKRFNAGGRAGLQDAPRAGRPPTYSPEQVGEVIATALTNPTALGLPFGSWTLDRLAAYLQAQRGIAMQRSRIDELLIAEGLRWRTQETWCGERVDPACAAPRGRSSPAPPSRRQAVS